MPSAEASAPANSPTGREANDPVVLAFNRHLESQVDQPDWWSEMKTRAIAAYQDLPMPTRRTEEWRLANLRGIDLDRYDYTPKLALEDLEKAAHSPDLIRRMAGRMIFADNKLVSHDRISAELADKGVIWEPLETALQKHPEIVRDYFMTQDPHLGSEKFAALHSAFVNSGCLLYVPKGVTVDLPFVARHWAAGDKSAVFPHTLVIAEEQASVTLVDTFESLDRQSQHFACGFNHLFAGEGARIDYQMLQNWSRHTLGFQINSMITGRDASIRSLSVNMGGSHCRTENQSLIKGEGSQVEMFSLSVTDRDQEIDQRTLQSHLAPHATSNLLYKNALMDTSRTIFSGLIKVAEDAQQTDAYQTNHNLLISPTAEANSLPGLEIQANDVRCSHGSTTGQLDEAQLFYMLTRGIHPDRARELLVFGFFEEVISKIENEELAESIRDLIQLKFREDMGIQATD